MYIGCLLICYTYNDFNQTSVGYITFINGIDVNVFQKVGNAGSVNDIVQCLTSDPFCVITPGLQMTLMLMCTRKVIVLGQCTTLCTV